MRRAPLHVADLASSATRYTRHARPSAPRRRNSSIGIGAAEHHSSKCLLCCYYTTSTNTSNRAPLPHRGASRTHYRSATRPNHQLASFSHSAAMCEADPTPSARTHADHSDTGAPSSSSTSSPPPASSSSSSSPSTPAALPPTPILSPNVPSPALAQQHLTTLLRPAGKWTLSAHRKGLERTFHFKTFKTTWSFMDAVAAQCRVSRHHPEWANVYNRVHVRWTTHRPEGLSMLDVEMAEFCDGAAGRFGEVDAVAPSRGGAVVVDGKGGGGGDAVMELSKFIAEDACDVCAR